jgi:tetratricopeptide (TPR) repeat protein
MTQPSAFAETQAAYERGDHADVLRRTEAILAERPGDDAAHELRARALMALGRLDEAERNAADAVRLDPDEVRYHELLAEVLAARGDHRDAAGEYARLARGDPSLPDWTLAEAQERLDAAQTEQGVDAARRAVRLDPRNAAAQLALAQGLSRMGQATPALEAATRAAELLPGDVRARETLADARWLSNEPAAAFREFRALANELPPPGRRRVVGKAQRLYRQRSGGLARWLAGISPLFELSLRNGWLNVR